MHARRDFNVITRISFCGGWTFHCAWNGRQVVAGQADLQSLRQTWAKSNEPIWMFSLHAL
jgi:hypothetical protein